MFKKNLAVLVIILSVGIVGSGCSKKAVVKEGSSVLAGEPSAAEQQRSRAEAERREREAKEAARLKEEQARKRSKPKKSLKGVWSPREHRALKGKSSKRNCLKTFISTWINITLIPRTYRP